MSAPLRIGIAGCTGRMGLTLLHAIESAKDVVLAGGTVPAGSSQEEALILARQGLSHVQLGEDIAALAARSDVLIDFTAPLYSLQVAKAAIDANVALVTGTTGFTDAQRSEMQAAAPFIPLVMASNTSIGVTVFATLVEQAARCLDEDYDIEIAEMHHRHKKDVPSGTALLLGEAAAQGRGRALPEIAVTERDGLREPGQIGFASLRGGEVVGDHHVIFAGPGERFELTHRASNRDIFARGALKAARWVAGQTAGLYSMRDVLGL